MNTIEYSTIDKSAWARGPWDDEPDKVQWPDEATGLPCLAVRHPENGHWCGYVGVAEGHPYFMKDRSEIEDSLTAHGGVNFSAGCQPGDDEATGVCHLPAEGEPDGVWWLGFDCAHAGDMSPGLVALLERMPRVLGVPMPEWIRRDIYRSLAYVQAECADLAHQLAGVRA